MKRFFLIIAVIGYCIIFACLLSVLGLILYSVWVSNSSIRIEDLKIKVLITSIIAGALMAMIGRTFSDD